MSLLNQNPSAFLSGSTVPLNSGGGGYMINGMPIGRWATQDPRRFRAVFGGTTVPTPQIHNVTQYGGEGWPEPTDPVEAPSILGDDPSLKNSMYGSPVSAFLPAGVGSYDSNQIARQLEEARRNYIRMFSGGGR